MCADRSLHDHDPATNFGRFWHPDSCTQGLVGQPDTRVEVSEYFFCRIEVTKLAERARYLSDIDRNVIVTRARSRRSWLG
ncbi:hypothetical protein D4765_12695 [Subtercola vilae]|uniref:Uncharacterized protein n=1 Tax=Subtercola vilae TaxID=2056433 RepID=A0A4T2BSY7_9MICO|nr:hypothetical protein D4765_12695 [Subtercola vilae]